MTQGIKKTEWSSTDGRLSGWRVGGCGAGRGGGSRPETGPTRAASRPSGTHTHTHTRARGAHTHPHAHAGRRYVRGGTRARACARPLRRRRQLFRVHTTGAGTEPASSIPRRAVDVGPTRVNQCEDDRRRVALRTTVFFSARAFVGALVCPSAGPGFCDRAGPVKKPAKRGTRIAGDRTPCDTDRRLVVMEVKKRYIWSDRETEHFIRLIIDMGMTNMLDSKR